MDAAEVGRFVFFGSVAALVNWVARFPLSLVFPFWLSVAVAYGIGMVAGFVLYRKYVFRRSSESIYRQLAVFLAVNAFGIVVVVAVSAVVSSAAMGLGIHKVVAEGVAHGIAIAVGSAASYLGHRFFTFAAQCDLA